MIPGGSDRRSLNLAARVAALQTPAATAPPTYPEGHSAMATTTAPSKVQQIEAAAQSAYDAGEGDWFRCAPLDHLTMLWGIACATGVAYDDELYDELARRGWFA